MGSRPRREKRRPSARRREHRLKRSFAFSLGRRAHLGEPHAFCCTSPQVLFGEEGLEGRFTYQMAVPLPRLEKHSRVMIVTRSLDNCCEDNLFVFVVTASFRIRGVVKTR